MNAPCERPASGFVGRAGSGGDELFLLPGQWWFGAAPPVTVRTLLGSCVAVTLWHPRWKIGAMCHFLLPTRGRLANGHLDGRYGDEAIELLRQSTLRVGIRPAEFETRLYGGGNMFATQPGAVVRDGTPMDIGARNAAIARERTLASGFGLLTADVGGTLHRHITLDVGSGLVAARAGVTAP